MFFIQFYILCANFCKIGPIIKKILKFWDDPLKIGHECISMQQAEYKCHRPTPWMQESVSMHKSPTPVRHLRMNQARSEEEEQKRGRDRKDRGREADGKKGSLTKHIWGTKRRPTQAQLRLTKQGKELWHSPSHRIGPLASNKNHKKRAKEKDASK